MVFPLGIQSVWSVPEYTNTAGIWFPSEIPFFGMSLNIRILRVFGAPFGNTNCLGMCLSIPKLWVFGNIRILRVFGAPPPGNTYCLGMCLNIPELRVFGNIRILRVFWESHCNPNTPWRSHNILHGNPLAHHRSPMGHPRAFPSATFWEAHRDPHRNPIGTPYPVGIPCG